MTVSVKIYLSFFFFHLEYFWETSYLSTFSASQILSQLLRMQSHSETPRNPFNHRNSARAMFKKLILQKCIFRGSCLLQPNFHSHPHFKSSVFVLKRYMESDMLVQAGIPAFSRLRQGASCKFKCPLSHSEILSKTKTKTTKYGGRTNSSFI